MANFGVVDVNFLGNVTNGTQQSGLSRTLIINFTRSGTISASQGQVFEGDGPYNISYQHISAATGTTDQDDVTDLTFFGNATLGSQITGIDISGVGAEINFTKAGVITLSGGNFSAGSYNASYTYEGDLYVVDTKAHPFIKLITIFFALVLVAIGIGAVLQSTFGFDFGFSKGKI